MEGTPNLSSIPKVQVGVGNILISLHGEKSVAKLSSTYPLKLLSVLTQGRTALVYLLTYGGGLVGGDKVVLDVNVESGANLIVQSQGTTKVFKSRQGRSLAASSPKFTKAFHASLTSQEFNFRISHNAILFLLPQPLTCFRDASYHQSQNFEIQEDGSAVILDWITSGRTSLGEEWDFSQYYSTVDLVHNGKRIARDVVLLDNEEFGCHIPARSLRQKLKPYSCYAMVILYGRHVQLVVSDIVSRYEKISIFQKKEAPELIWSLSRIDSTNLGIIVRMAGLETETVREWLKDALVGLKDMIGSDLYRQVFPDF